MKQNPSWEVINNCVSQEILRILWDPKVDFIFIETRHWSRSSARLIQPTLSKTILLRSVCILSFKSTPKSYKWALSYSFPHQRSVWISLPPCMPHAPSILLSLISRFKPWSSTFCSFTQFSIASSLIVSNVFLTSCSKKIPT